MRRLSLALALPLFFLEVFSAAVKNDLPPVARLQKRTSAIRIDGRLDDPAWQSADIIDGFSQRDPDEGRPVSERTELRLLYDEKNLYVGFRCYDREPQKIVANEMRRDIQLLHNDCVEIYLDTYRDGRTAFCFATNALGAQRDGLITTETDETMQNWDWNGIWQNACRIDEEGWTAEIAVPFQTLRYPGAENQVWGANFVRIIPRKREEAYWSPIWREYGYFGKYRIAAFGRLEGLSGLERPRTFEMKPYLLGRLQSEEPGAGLDFSFDPGLDGKVRIASNLTADITVNTDFAHVEADQEQVNLTRFELFFPEKRDFFLEGASLFRAGERTSNPLFPSNLLFFSRRFGLSEDNHPLPILAGVKATGRQGGYNLGILDILSGRAEYEEEGERIVVPRTNFTVLRLQRDVSGRSAVGFIGLNKESLDDDSYNRCFALDGQFFLGRYAQANGYLAKSFTPGLTGKDWAGYADLVYNSDFWSLGLTQNLIGENFNDEMGYWPRPGTRNTHVSVGIGPRPRILNIRQLFLFDDYNIFVDTQGRTQTRSNMAGFLSYFQNGSSLMALLIQNLERLDEEFEISNGIFIPVGDHHFNYLYAEYQSDKSRSLSALLNFQAGGFYSGSIRSVSLSTEWKAGRHAAVNLMASRNEVRLPADSFDTTVVSARIIYSFHPRLFAKLFVQYNSEENRLMANLLVHLIHRPGSDLFFVYNQEWSHEAGRLRSENRALVLKFNRHFTL